MIFQKIAKEASRIMHNESGKGCYVNKLRKLDSGDLIPLEFISYADFKFFDFSGVDWSQIYCS